MELEEALTKIAEMESEIDKLQANNAKVLKDKEDISKNFEEFRKNSTLKEKELEDKFNNTFNEYDGYKKSIEAKETERKSKFISDKILEKARGDKELAEKISNEYKNFNLPEDNDESILSRIEKASALHTKADNTTTPAPAGGSGKPDGAKADKGELEGNAKNVYDFLMS